MSTMELEERTLWNRLKRKAEEKFSSQTASTPSKVLGIAIAGAGNVVRWKYVPQLRQKSLFRPIAIYDVNSAACQDVASQLNCKALNNLDLMLADSAVDIVCICTPPDSHCEIALKALQAKKHVLCEKPMAATLQQAEKMAEAARHTNLVTMIHFAYRFTPEWMLVHDIVKSGILGQLYTVWGALSQGGWFDAQHNPSQERPDAAAWRYGPEGGILAEMGSHLVDLCRWCFGDIAEVRASSKTFGAADKTSEDVSAMTFTFHNGCIGQLQVSRLVTGSKERAYLEVNGSEGTLRLDQGNVSLWTRAEPRWRTLMLPPRVPGAFLDLFHQAVVNPKNAPAIPTFEDGVKNNEVLNAIITSTKTGMPQPRI